MKLYELLETINENATVIVKSIDDTMLTFYDGKNSIDPLFNNDTVFMVDNADNAIIVYVYGELFYNTDTETVVSIDHLKACYNEFKTGTESFNEFLNSCLYVNNGCLKPL